MDRIIEENIQSLFHENKALKAAYEDLVVEVGLIRRRIEIIEENK